MNVKLTNLPTLNVGTSEDIYYIMQRILMRENRIDRGREHFWTISLDHAHKILNIELVSLGTATESLVAPMEVISVPLQKRAAKIVLVHNHPSGTLKPSDADKDITDRLIQVGRIMHMPVLDHLIITEKSYYSFADSGLLRELEKSVKYVPPYELKQRIELEIKEMAEQKGREKQAKEIAKTMKQEGFSPEDIAKITGLTKQAVQRIKK